jgi:hypothetical protein
MAPRAVFAAALLLASCRSGVADAEPAETAVLEGLIETLQFEASTVQVDPRTLGWKDEFGWMADAAESAEVVWQDFLRRWSEELHVDDCDVRGMLVELRERNEHPRRWSLSASPPARLEFDSGRTHDSTFEAGGGGWERWNRDHPDSAGYLRVSRPVLDARHGYVLLYCSWDFDMLAGHGCIGLYRLRGDKLECVKSVQTWIS